MRFPPPVLEADHREARQHLEAEAAELAGVSIGSLYEFFPNKDAIFTGLRRLMAMRDGSAAREITDLITRYLVE